MIDDKRNKNDQVLKCLDIGTGTSLLSLYALKRFQYLKEKMNQETIHFHDIYIEAFEVYIPMAHLATRMIVFQLKLLTFFLIKF